MGSTSDPADEHSDGSMLEVAHGRTAAELPATRSSLRRSSILVGLLAVSAVGLLVLGGGLRWRQYQMTSLATTGVRTTATVDRVQSWTVGREHHIIGFIDVSYSVAGRAQPVRFDVSNHVQQYHDGDRVDVAYDADQPDRVDLVNEPAASRGFLPWEVPTAFAALAGLMSAIAVRHLRGAKRLLGAHEWLAVPAVLRPSSRGLRGRGTTVVELGEPASPERVVASAVGMRALPPTVEPVAWVAGWGKERFMLAPPGGRPLLLMHRLSELGVDAVPIRTNDIVPDLEQEHQRHAP